MNSRVKAKWAFSGVLIFGVTALSCLGAEARTYHSLFSFFEPARRAAPRTARKPQWTRQVAPIARKLAAPREIPLPPRRPVEFAAPVPPPTPVPAPNPPAAAAAQAALPPATPPSSPPPPSSAPGDDAETCTAVMASGKVLAEEIPAIQSGACGIAHPVMLQAIVLGDKRQIKLEPPVAMRCRLAGALADWIVDDVAPLVAEAGQPLVALSGVGAYQCRGRNGVAGAKLSEHAIGNAIDIGGLKLADARIVTVQQQPGTEPLLEKVRATACARFSTVLGPGSDAFHGNHVHLDLEERRHGNKLCQWNFPQPAVPATPAAPVANQPASPPTPPLPPEKPPSVAEQKK